MTPLDEVEVLYQDLVAHYGEGQDREIRAASKLLMVALDKMKAHGGAQWRELVLEYSGHPRHCSDVSVSLLIDVATSTRGEPQP